MSVDNSAAHERDDELRNLSPKQRSRRRLLALIGGGSLVAAAAEFLAACAPTPKPAEVAKPSIIPNVPRVDTTATPSASAGSEFRPTAELSASFDRQIQELRNGGLDIEKSVLSNGTVEIYNASQLKLNTPAVEQWIAKLSQAAGRLVPIIIDSKSVQISLDKPIRVRKILIVDPSQLARISLLDVNRDSNFIGGVTTESREGNFSASVVVANASPAGSEILKTELCQAMLTARINGKSSRDVVPKSTMNQDEGLPLFANEVFCNVATNAQQIRSANSRAVTFDLGLNRISVSNLTPLVDLFYSSSYQHLFLPK